VSVMAKAPRVKPRLPIAQPPGADWEVRIVAVIGRFALTVRRLGQTYSNAVVEKHFGVPATTRNWNTLVSVAEVLVQGFCVAFNRRRSNSSPTDLRSCGGSNNRRPGWRHSGAAW